MLKPSAGPGTLLVETNKFDVFLGRGKNANNRQGNISFRKLVLELFDAYQSTDSGEEKTAMATKLVCQIQAQGGRFIRPVSAANSSGQQVSAWEVVSDDVAVAKVKQAVRDVAIGRKRKAKKERREQQINTADEHKAQEQPPRDIYAASPQAVTLGQFQLQQQQGLIDTLLQSQQQSHSTAPHNVASDMSALQQRRIPPNLVNPQLLPAAVASMIWSETNPPGSAFAVTPMLHRIQQLERARQERQLLGMLNAQRAHPADYGGGNRSRAILEALLQSTRPVQSSSHLGGSATAIGRANPLLQGVGYQQQLLEPPAEPFSSMSGANRLHPALQFGQISSRTVDLSPPRPSLVSALDTQESQQVSRVVVAAAASTNANINQDDEPTSQQPESPLGYSRSRRGSNSTGSSSEAAG